jgi:predicted aminopeptidase
MIMLSLYFSKDSLIMREYCPMAKIITPIYPLRTFFSLAILLLLSACSDLGYYWHTSTGHIALMNQRVYIDNILEDPDLDPKFRERLLLVKAIRVFSVETLALPKSDSYNNYVQLDRAYVLQNLFAAAEFSTDLYLWCYPIVGCAGYRGYYDEEMLASYVEQLKAQNFDTYIGNVPAYSTLGWFDDPVLSSFIYWPDYRLAGLLFHELSHQRIYIKNDTQFNESLAVAIQQAGTELWLKTSQRGQQLEEYRRWIEYQGEVIKLIEETRETLAELYRSDHDEVSMREQKQLILAGSRDNYAALALRLNYRDGFANWFAGDLNNARLGSVSAYHAQKPAFLAILKARDNNFEAFFKTVESISKLDKSARDRCLALWLEGKVVVDEGCPKAPG